MTPSREALTLPLVFLTVVLMGSVRFGPPLQFAPPSVFALVLAMMLVAALVQSGALAPAALIASERSALQNLNGLAVTLTLFVASAQAMSVIMPQRGAPAVMVGTLLFALLAQALAIGAASRQLLRGLLVSLALAFVLKFVILDALAGPASSRSARIVQLLFEGVTLGTLTQSPHHPATGYLAFATLVLYLFGIVLLPRRGAQPWVDQKSIGDRSSEALQRR